MDTKVYNNFYNYITRLLALIFTLSSIFKWLGLKTFSLTISEFCVFLGYDVLYGHSMVLAVIICSTELILGIAAFIPRLRNYVVWGLFSVMSYFTVITYLNLVNLYGQIESCGCFGEVIHLSPAESFYKNVILWALSLIACVLTIYNKEKKTCH